MTPSRVETFVYKHNRMLGKTVEEKDFTVKEKRSSSLPAEILEIQTNNESTLVKMKPRHLWWITTEGDVKIEKMAETASLAPGSVPKQEPFLLITISGEGSSIEYEPEYGSFTPRRRPDLVKITHRTQK